MQVGGTTAKSEYHINTKITTVDQQHWNVF